jgi:hypothetical protein
MKTFYNNLSLVVSKDSNDSNLKFKIENDLQFAEDMSLTVTLASGETVKYKVETWDSDSNDWEVFKDGIPVENEEADEEIEKFSLILANTK